MGPYDVVIVGAGTGGQTVAHDLNAEGLKVAVVEKSEHPGGVCALAGCQAKKWFYETAEIAARSRHLAGKGVVREPVVDWVAVLKEKNRFTSGIPESTVKGLTGEGIDFLQGEARFVDPETLLVGGEKIRSRYFVLAAGARPMLLPIAGAEYLTTSDQFLSLPALPERIVFVGGGFISFEFAHFAARFSNSPKRIVILEAAERPLGPFDAEMVSLLTEASETEGIEVLTRSALASIEKKGNALLVHGLDSGTAIEADLVVHGAGRVPDIEPLQLDRAGVAFSDKGVAVNEEMRTTASHIFAVGDCADTIQLARVADYEAHVAADNIVADIERSETRRMDYQAVPFLLFTYPQYGMVGKTEEALREEGTVFYKSSGNSLGWPTYKRVGMQHAAYKLLVDGGNRLLGAHILSDNASGLIGILRLAMLNDIDMAELHRQSIMSPYPSRESDLIYMLVPFAE